MYTPISLTLIGFVLIFLEFFLPGAIMAVLGGLAIATGAVLFSISDVPLVYKITYFISLALLFIITCKLALSVIKNRQRKNYVLETDQSEFIASSLDMDLVGQPGEAASDLKPSGYILVGQKRVQAISESDYIGKGQKITIIGGRGAYFIVKES